MTTPTTDYEFLHYGIRFSPGLVWHRRQHNILQVIKPVGPVALYIGLAIICALGKHQRTVCAVFLPATARPSALVVVEVFWCFLAVAASTVDSTHSFERFCAADGLETRLD
jgi:hypothetical protein